MPIKPPKLDDRSYEDIVAEARALIPQYCPEWTHLGDSDPGMTLVQLFAWMTEMTLYRLNRVPDKTYVHFLNFIGEERRSARPARAAVSLQLRGDDAGVVELPANTRCSTRSKSGGEALHFLTEQPLTVHGATIDRMVAVRAGPLPMVRELSFEAHPDNDQALLFDGGDGMHLLQLDPVDDGPWAWTPDQAVYLRHEDFGRMVSDEEGRGPVGSLRIRSEGKPGLPVAALFDWAYPITGGTFRPLAVDQAASQDLLGLPDTHLEARLDEPVRLEHFGDDDEPLPLPEGVDGHHWIRGRVRFEPWLAQLMEEELQVTWRDDRGAEERQLNNWTVRAVGRSLEFFVQNVPPIRAGWLLRFTMVDHGLPTGRDAYFPRYRWSYRRGERWVSIRDERVERVGATFVIAGPLTDMATDGFNLRAERVETLDLTRVLPELKAQLTWRRPIDVRLATGPEDDAAAALPLTSLPAEPFQVMPSLPALLGMKLYLGSDLLANRLRSAVELELEVGFERGGKPVAEPTDDYHLQLAYRAGDGWRTVHGTDVDFAEFTFADLDPDGAEEPDRRRIRVVLDPREQLDGLARVAVGGHASHWLRLELTRAALTHQADERSPPEPVSLRLYGIKLSLDGKPGVSHYDEPMPGTRVVAVAQRRHNPRFTELLTRQDGAVVVERPFDDLIAVDDPDGHGHTALYLRLDRPLPRGARHALTFRCRGETYLPRGFSAQWELLERAGRGGGRRWRRLGADDADGPHYAMERTGVLEFPLEDDIRPAADGAWMRVLLRHDGEGPFPALPPVTHLLLNTVDAVNLHGFRVEKFSGQGIPHHKIQLRHFPVYLPPEDGSGHDAAGLVVTVEEADGERRPWRVAVGNAFTTATKDDRVFTVDPVEGTLAFGNGIRGRIPPAGAFNIVVERYHTVPGAAGNVGVGEVVLCESFGDVVEVSNLLPAGGGRNAESIDEIIRRAPSVLTSRDRAVTRRDFEIIAEEASAEVARAACVGSVGADGGIEVIILPRRRPGEVVPDPFVAAGLEDHVQRYLSRRCLVNVRPRVRQARFRIVDVALRLRLRGHANPIAVREDVIAWVTRFLDPYEGGLDGEGWPFAATLYAQDFGRIVRDIPAVRHVVGVQLYGVDDLEEAPGWQRVPGAGEGDAVMPLGSADLFRPREVRVVLTEDRG